MLELLDKTTFETILNTETEDNPVQALRPYRLHTEDLFVFIIFQGNWTARLQRGEQSRTVSPVKCGHNFSSLLQVRKSF